MYEDTVCALQPLKFQQDLIPKWTDTFDLYQHGLQTALKNHLSQILFLINNTYYRQEMM